MPSFYSFTATEDRALPVVSKLGNLKVTDLLLTIFVANALLPGSVSAWARTAHFAKRQSMGRSAMILRARRSKS
jgi:hypothetical protein